MGAEVALGAGFGGQHAIAALGSSLKLSAFSCSDRASTSGSTSLFRTLHRIRRSVALVRRVGAAAVWFTPPTATVDIKRCVAYTQRYV